MRDPFAPNTKPRSLRETWLGLAAVALLLCVFAYLTYHRITAQRGGLPEHVRLAPVAEMVWPNHGAPPTDQAAAERQARIERRLKNEFAITPQPHKQTIPALRFSSTPSFKSQTPPQASVTPTVKPTTDPGVALAQFQQAAKQVNAAIAEIENLAQAEPLQKLKIQPPTKPLGIKRRGEEANGFSPTRITTPRRATDVSQASEFGLRPKIKTNDKTNAKEFKPLRGKPPQPVNAAAAKSVKLATPKVIPSRPIVTKQPTQDFSPVVTRPAAQRDIARAKPVKPLKPLIEEHEKQPKEEPQPAPTELSPAQENRDMYTVETGDSFWSIATQHYGDGRLFRALYHWNIDVVGDFESPTPGMRLQIPAQQQLVARLSEFCPEDLVGKQPTMVTPSQTDAPTYNPASNEHLYTTREGDTLFEIAGDRLGQASRYMDIIAANDDRLPANVTHLTRLAGGLELVLPLSH